MTAISAPLCLRAQPYEQTILIDPSVLNGAERAVVLRAVSQLSPPDEWKEIRVHPGQRLFGIAQDQYRFADGYSPQEARAIVDIIADANDLKDPSSIKTGQVLRVPVLPVRPLSRGAAVRFVQSFSRPGSVGLEPAVEAFAGLSKGGALIAAPPTATATPTQAATATSNPQVGNADEIQSATTAAVATPVPVTASATRQWATATPQGVTVTVPPQTAASELAKAAIWHFEQSSTESARFLSMLPETVREKLLYSGPGAGVWAHLEPLQPSGINVNPEDREAKVTPQFHDAAAAVVASHATKYIVLDFFKQPEGPSCGHGEKVQDVIRLRLEELGASQLQNNVVLVDLNFSKNEAANLHTLRAYLTKELPVSSQIIIDSMLNAITETAKGKDEFDVPLLYLQALLSEYVSDASVSVISSQFVTSIEPFRLLPRTYGSDSKICLVSGVLNIPNSYIESISSREPLKSYWDVRQNYGVLLIAGLDAQANVLTMSSQQGDGVTCGAMGTGWGKPGNCITPSDWGASYATPAYATDMFVLRSLWEEGGTLLEAREVRRRLLLASQVALPVVSKVACGGFLDVERARLAPGAVIVKSTGEPGRIKLNEAWVDVSANSAMPTWRRIRRPYGMNDTLETIGSGLQFVGQQAFVFEEPAERWRPIQLRGLTVTITGEEGSVYTLDLARFRERYSSLLVF